jgi:hypothetical protein
VAPGPPLHDTRQPLPPPVEQAIKREPVIEEERPSDDERSFRMIPMPGGCIMVSTPRSRSW